MLRRYFCEFGNCGAQSGLELNFIRAPRELIPAAAMHRCGGSLGAAAAQTSKTHWRMLSNMKLPKLQKPFSMIREFHLADWFTLANAACGMGALFATMTYLQTTDIRHIYYACGMVVAAGIFDVLDGRIARWRQKTSAMGRELDSLADVISFGVAPAVIAYGCGMQGLYDRIVLAAFVACGVSRLARYNITAETLSDGGDKVKYFEGTPIPSSLLLVALLFVAALQGAVGDALWFGQLTIAGFVLHPLVLFFAVSGALMVSRIHFPKF